MQIEHLRTFVYITDCGSLSAAARARRISQPAVTKQVQRMEAELGAALLVRGPKRQAKLTPAGEKVQVFARDTLARFEALERDLAALRAVGSGTLHLAASTIPGEYILPGLLAAFRTQYPQVEVQMTISDTDRVVAKLLADEADVGVIGSHIKRPGLRLERLVADEVILAAPPDHPFAARQSVAVHELQGQPLIMREEGSGTRRSVEEALASAGFNLPQDNIVLTLGSTQAILQAVAQGLGLGFVSTRAAAQSLAAGQLASVGLNGVDLGRDLYLAYLPQQISEPQVVHFMNSIRAQVADQPAFS
jgi:DNA-binding transcriptional LysR family regulator